MHSFAGSALPCLGTTNFEMYVVCAGWAEITCTKSGWSSTIQGGCQNLKRKGTCLASAKAVVLS